MEKKRPKIYLRYKSMGQPYQFIYSTVRRKTPSSRVLAGDFDIRDVARVLKIKINQFEADPEEHEHVLDVAFKKGISLHLCEANGSAN